VHGANIITVAVSSDESLLATGSTDRTIGIFSLASVVAQGPLQALAVLKVAEAVCLDISWGRWFTCPRFMRPPLNNAAPTERPARSISSSPLSCPVRRSAPQPVAACTLPPPTFASRRHAAQVKLPSSMLAAGLLSAS
jgi:hypothetical protein